MLKIQIIFSDFDMIFVGELFNITYVIDAYLLFCPSIVFGFRFSYALFQFGSEPYRTVIFFVIAFQINRFFSLNKFQRFFRPRPQINGISQRYVQIAFFARIYFCQRFACQYVCMYVRTYQYPHFLLRRKRDSGIRYPVKTISPIPHISFKTDLKCTR